jgi:transcription elongation factor Elf1
MNITCPDCGKEQLVVLDKVRKSQLVFCEHCYNEFILILHASTTKKVDKPFVLDAMLTKIRKAFNLE